VLDVQDVVADLEGDRGQLGVLGDRFLNVVGLVGDDRGEASHDSAETARLARAHLQILCRVDPDIAFIVPADVHPLTKVGAIEFVHQHLVGGQPSVGREAGRIPADDLQRQEVHRVAGIECDIAAIEAMERPFAASNRGPVLDVVDDDRPVVQYLRNAGVGQIFGRILVEPLDEDEEEYRTPSFAAAVEQIPQRRRQRALDAVGIVLVVGDPKNDSR